MRARCPAGAKCLHVLLDLSLSITPLGGAFMVFVLKGRVSRRGRGPGCRPQAGLVDLFCRTPHRKYFQLRRPDGLLSRLLHSAIAAGKKPQATLNK